LTREDDRLEYERGHIEGGLALRVTAETKAETRHRILDAARHLFVARGYDATTTRDIAEAAGIANGTLFNYFASKEAILTSLVAEVAAGIHGDLENLSPEAAGPFEEHLFAFVAGGLRKLKPWRKQLPVLLETALNPLTTAPPDDAQAMRVAHLDTVARLARRHGLGDLPAMALQLYWTLYVGVLMFWARDSSPRQEDTLGLLDSSLAMFTGWLQPETTSPSEKTKGEA
jgi:AcrR family transcriptional regulator